MSEILCISGIDTDIGKTVVTGLMARALLVQGHTVITQKVAQTGCTGIAEDIRQHRKLMSVELFPEDKNGLTCPYVFSKACSPHLAAELEHTQIDLNRITEATQKLAANYEYVLLEGAGGLMVPLTREITFFDYLQEQDYPLILVTSPRLGSINHTLSALELAKQRGIKVRGLIYNRYDADDNVIANDSRKVFAQALQNYGFSPNIVDMVSAKTYTKHSANFDCCF